MTVTQYHHTGAELSNDLRHRHVLWREWAHTAVPPHRRYGYCTFVMLNPSTADGLDDDPTIRRCIAFAKRFGYNRLEVVNLFDYRTSSPKALMALGDGGDPCSADNQRFVQKSVEHAGMIIYAWGANGSWMGQDETVRGWVDEVRNVKPQCLGLTKDGHPKHPLYLPSGEPLRDMPE